MSLVLGTALSKPVLAQGPKSVAGVDCSSLEVEKPISSVEASASFFSNTFNRESSIRYQSNLMFTAARERALKEAPPGDPCGDHCDLRSPPAMIFKSTPTNFLADYGEDAQCELLFQKTSRDPLKYSKKLPVSLDALEDWINDFSQGSGAEGRDLYQRCPGKCSPQYTYVIAKEGEQLNVTARVICGHARDKDEDLYRLSYSFRWGCEEAA